jgi:hypothetical protein
MAMTIYFTLVFSAVVQANHLATFEHKQPYSLTTPVAVSIANAHEAAELVLEVEEEDQLVPVEAKAVAEQKETACVDYTMEGYYYNRAFRSSAPPSGKAIALKLFWFEYYCAIKKKKNQPNPKMCTF